MMSVCEKKFLAEVQLIHAEQISLHKFDCFQEKTVDTTRD